MSSTLCLAAETTGNQSLLSIPTKEVLPSNGNNNTLDGNRRGEEKSGIITSLENLSTTLQKYLDWKEELIFASKNGEGDIASSSSSSFIYDCHDGNLLRCAKRDVITNNDGVDDVMVNDSIFGIHEHQHLFHHDEDSSSHNSDISPNVMKDEKDMGVQLSILKPDLNDPSSWKNSCSCHRLHFDWTRQPHSVDCADDNNDGLTMHNKYTKQRESNAKITIYDLTNVQTQRKSKEKGEDIQFQFDTPSKICHLLRSTFRNSNNGDDGNKNAHDPHIASPWSKYLCCKPLSPSSSSSSSDLSSVAPPTKTNFHKSMINNIDQVFGIILKNQVVLNNSEDSTDQLHQHDNIMNDEWEELEKKELLEVMKFRTGDACPSYYLHSASYLNSQFTSESYMNDFNGGAMNIQMNDGSKSGCTLLIYRQIPRRSHFLNYLDRNNKILQPGCLWEQVRILGNNEKTSRYRMVAPPYQSHEDLYCDLLKKTFLDPKNLKHVIKEARRIPHWTAWPERNHYQSDYDKDDGESSGGVYPASWTVFPLCHTFPANDASSKKWISKTTAFAPKTTELLQALGPTLRTALFSRLDPRTILGSHTGWADLANHVLRVHIPLIIPSGGINDGLCGTWVDGCVETHEPGKIICFDDSKTHRAFNYSEEERVVLIIDLARPPEEDGFPKGTAAGGHTNELDAFINQFN